MFFSLSLHPHHWEGERRKHVLQELDYFQWKACCIVHPCPCRRFGLAPPRHSSCSTLCPHRYPSLHLTLELLAMAEMADLTSALNKMEVTKKPEEEKASPPAEQPEQPKKSEESPPASSDKPAEEESPPASSDKPEEKKSPPSQ